MSAGPYSIGSSNWPGLSKLAEEAGETLQVIGKLMATGGEEQHWDGSDLRVRLAEEIADLMAACMFVVTTNGLGVDARVNEKLQLFHEWHRAQSGLGPTKEG